MSDNRKDLIMKYFRSKGMVFKDKDLEIDFSGNYIEARPGFFLGRSEVIFKKDALESIQIDISVNYAGYYLIVFIAFSIAAGAAFFLKAWRQ